MLVFFEIHGSSIGLYNDIVQPGLNTSKYSSPLIGHERRIRTDEWGLHTPMALSQKYQDYPLYNSLWRNAPTNMALIYNQPVKNFLYLIAKPFQWGYIFLGNAKGLSWFWCGRTIFLFLVTFEFFRIFAPRSRILPLLGAFLVVYSPAVQWWFAINDFAEQIFWGELGVIAVFYFMQSNKIIVKTLLSLVFGICCGGFILCFYPAWQVPFAYIFVVIGLRVFFYKFKNSEIEHKKSELLYLLLALFIASLIVVPIIVKSLPDIEIIRNTVYPGGRFSTGGNGMTFLFYYLSNRLIFYIDNTCERSHFIGLFPLPAILSVVYLLQNKFKDKLVLSLSLVQLFFLTFIVFGFSHEMAKYTLLYLTTPNRIMMASSFIDVFLLIRLFSMDMELNKYNLKFIISAIYTLFAVYGFALLRKAAISKDLWTQSIYLNNINLKDVYIIMAGLFLFIAVFVLLTMYANKSKYLNKFFVLIMLVLFLCFGFVNPIVKGLDAIEEIPAGKEIKKIQSTNPGLWLVDSRGYFELSNFPIMFGAPTIASTNIYPNFDFYRILDPEGKYFDLYNRYARLTTFILEDYPTYFEGKDIDSCVLILNINDVPKLNVDYILTRWFEKPEYILKGNYRIYQIYNEGGIKIYKTEKLFL